MRMLRPDSKGRVTLGALANGISGFELLINKEKYIILKPFVEIPADEEWLSENEHALMQVNQGLDDSAAGRVTKKGSFAKHLKSDDE